MLRRKQAIPKAALKIPHALPRTPGGVRSAMAARKMVS